MKKIILIAAALSAIGLTAPAAAQDRYGNNNHAYGYSNGNGGIQARMDQLQRRLHVGIQRGTISRQEAARLSDGFRQLNRLERQYSRGGLNHNERRDLQQRIQQLQHQIQLAERSRDSRYGRDHDRDDRYGRDDDRDGRNWNDGRGDRNDRNDGDRRWDDRRDRD